MYYPVYYHNPGDAGLESLRRRFLETAELADYVALALAAARYGQDPLEPGWQVRITYQDKFQATTVENEASAGQAWLAPADGVVDQHLRLGGVHAVRVYPDMRVTYVGWLGLRPAEVQPTYEHPVLSIQALPPVAAVMRSLQEGDRIYVKYGSGSRGGSRVVDVLKVEQQPQHRHLDFRAFTTSAGKARGGPQGGVIEQWARTGQQTGESRPQFQPTFNSQSLPILFLEKVGEKFQKKRRKPVTARPIRLGTKRSRDLFSQIVTATSYSRDNYFSGSPIDPAWARANLEQDVIRRGVKSIRDDGNGSYTIRFHSNHWITFTTTPAPAVAPIAAPAIETDPFPVAPAIETDPFPVAPAVEAPPAPPPPMAEEWIPPVAEPFDAPAAPPTPEELAHQSSVSSYQRRIEDKRQRLLSAARRARAASQSAFRASHDMADRIPMGQPILVGHHSERRHRRDLARIGRGMDKAVELEEKAAGLERAAARIGTGGISADDPEAVHKLEAELERERAFHAEAKRLNAALRKAMKGKKASVEAHLKAIDALNTTSDLKDQLRSYARAFPWTPQFGLPNISARIKRIQERIAELRREDARPAMEAPVAYEAGGFEVYEDQSLNRLQLTFQGKPGAKTRAALKSHGFRWAPSVGAWQRQLNEAARRTAGMVATQIAGHGGWQQNPPALPPLNQWRKYTWEGGPEYVFRDEAGDTYRIRGGRGWATGGRRYGFLVSLPGGGSGFFAPDGGAFKTPKEALDWLRQNTARQNPPGSKDWDEGYRAGEREVVQDRWSQELGIRYLDQVGPPIDEFDAGHQAAIRQLLGIPQQNPPDVELVVAELKRYMHDDPELSLDDAVELLWTNVRDDKPSEYFAGTRLASYSMPQVEALIDQAARRLSGS